MNRANRMRSIEVLFWKVRIGRCGGGLRESAARSRGAHGLALLDRRIAEAGEQVVEVRAQAGDRLGVDALPAIGEATGG